MVADPVVKEAGKQVSQPEGMRARDLIPLPLICHMVALVGKDGLPLLTIATCGM